MAIPHLHTILISAGFGPKKICPNLEKSEGDIFQNISFLGNDDPLAISLLQFYKVLWIYNSDPTT